MKTLKQLQQDINSEMKEGYDDNRRGFGKRPREDDEYHVPDPTVKKNKAVKEETLDQRKDREKQLKNFKQFTDQMYEQAPIAPSLMKHKISVTVSDPNHSMITKRKEKIQKTVIVTHSDNKAGAQKVGEKFYKKKGFIVHDSNHIGLKDFKEEVSLDEANHREFAQHGKMHPDMAKHMSLGRSMDYYHPNNGDKVSGKVIKKTDKEVHMKSDHNGKAAAGPVHIFHIADKIEEDTKHTSTGLVHTKNDYEGNPSTFKDKEQNKLDTAQNRHRMNKAIPSNDKLKDMDESAQAKPPFDGPYTNSKPDTKDKSGATHSPMSRAKHLARQAMKAQMKEDIDQLFEQDKQEYDYEGDMVINQLKTAQRCAQMLLDKLKPDDNLPEWVQSKITLASDYIATAADYMYSEMNEELKGAQHKIDKNHNGKIDGQDFKMLRSKKVCPKCGKNPCQCGTMKEALLTSLGKKVPTDGKSPVSVKVNAAGNKPEEESGKPSKVKEQLSYKEFLAALEEGTVMRSPGGLVHKGNRGYGNEPHHDDPDRDSYGGGEKTNQAPSEKRGRGRPAGSKAGPRKITGTSKLFK